MELMGKKLTAGFAWFYTAEQEEIDGSLAPIFVGGYTKDESHIVGLLIKKEPSPLNMD